MSSGEPGEGATEPQTKRPRASALGRAPPQSSRGPEVRDSTGRLTHAAFAQTASWTPGSGQRWYDNSHPATRRARARYLYDPAGRASSVEHYWDVYASGAFTGTPLLAQDYAYSTSTRLRTSATFKHGSGSNWASDRTEYYGYDASLDYLVNVDYNDGISNEYQTWTYDDAGNRASDSTVSGSYSWDYDNLNRMKSDPVNRYRNDILGNRQDRNYNQSTGGAIYEWDALNRMTKTANSSSGAQYTYRADGMRIEKVEGLTLSWVQDNPKSGHYDQNWSQNLPTTRYFYDGQMAMEEDYTTGSEENPQVTVTRYGIGARGIDYIDKTVDGSYQGCQFPIYDGHGNMIATIARSGSTPYHVEANLREFDVWGRVRAQSSVDSPNGPKLRYVANLGHPTDDESGLIYMRARYYEPWTGRFVSEDPKMSGPNYYLYSENDPIQFSDPSGGLPEWVEAVMLGGWVGFNYYLMYVNSKISHAARQVAIAGTIFLALWFNDRVYSRGNPEARLTMGMGMYLLTHMMAEHLMMEANMPWGEAPAGIAQKAQATVWNYMIVMELFLVMEIYLDN